MIEKIKNYFIDLYKQLVNVDDTPARIALGFGVGVFLGILPGTGLIAAIGAAFIFRLNKPATMLGCVLTNAWLSIVTFVLSLKIGSMILGVQWQSIMDQTKELMLNFTWKSLLDVSLMNILKPLFVGYIVVGILCGILAYLIVLSVFYLRTKTKYK